MTPIEPPDGAVEEHPSVLPWYVSGKLDPAEAARVREHLLDCAGCRGEVEALASMRRTHLAYRDDLELLERLDDPGSAAVAARSGTPRTRATPWAWALVGAAAASLLIVALPALRIAGREPPRGPLLLEAKPIVLLPAQRGAAGEPVLRGSGPWWIQVVLPLDAPEVPHRVWIEREGGGVVHGSETQVGPAVGGQVTLLLKSPADAGRYRMMLEPAQGGPEGGGNATVSVYPFEVAP